jgi:dihydroflavonol-4-reductase
VLAIEKGQVGRSYFLTGPTHTFVDSFAIAEAITGIPAPRFHASPMLLKALAAAVSLLEQIVPLPTLATAEGLRVVAGTTYIGSGARAVRELGWEARPLADGLRETLLHEMRLLGLSATAGRRSSPNAAR